MSLQNGTSSEVSIVSYLGLIKQGPKTIDKLEGVILFVLECEATKAKN